MKAYAKEHRSQDLWLLLSAPGIGDVLALTILYEIETVERFATPRTSPAIAVWSRAVWPRGESQMFLLRCLTPIGS